MGCPGSCPQPRCSISGITLDSFLCFLTLLALTEVGLGVCVGGAPPCHSHTLAWQKQPGGAQS